MESLNDALVECVKALGGSKQVGPWLWPEKTPDAAQRSLLDSLNEDRPAKLSPDQVMLILRKAREIGCHAGITYILRDLGYADPVPIDPRDEVVELQRQLMETLKAQERMTERLERAIGRVAMRAVA